VVERFDGSIFARVTSGVTTQLNGVANFDDKNVFVVGDGGVILHSDGGSAPMFPRTSGTAENLESVWGSSASDVYAVGGNGTILHSTDGDGMVWVADSVPVSELTTHFYGVFGSGPNDVYAVGQGGTILHKP
jgi:photosystem II stability/assembly factor-like uncharacterized protein